jgi:hypothetical protein
MSGAAHISDYKGVPYGPNNPLFVSVTSSPDVTPKSIKTVFGSVSSNTQIIPSTPGRKIKIRYCKLRTSYSGGTITPILTDGNGGTTIWGDPLLEAVTGSISGSNEGVTAPDALCSTSVGNALYLNPNGQTVGYAISYFDDDSQ